MSDDIKAYRHARDRYNIELSLLIQDVQAMLGDIEDSFADELATFEEWLAGETMPTRDDLIVQLIRKLEAQL